ncbi:ribosome assembly RNA-binding protein YhbY [Candidatus Woesearchaeota archaeon]|nr:ribosome assembly RNA-binding protein YhbY [Candidatus Woesearchaeota archaeon]
MKELRKKAHHLTPIVEIGKQGLTDGVLEQIRTELKRKRLIKVRMRQTVEEKKTLVEKLISETGATLVQHVGHVVTLHK